MFNKQLLDIYLETEKGITDYTYMTKPPFTENLVYITYKPYTSKNYMMVNMVLVNMWARYKKLKRLINDI